MSRTRESDMFISSRAVLNSMEKLSAPIDPTSRSSISYCRTRTMLISRQSWTNGSASITSQDHMEPLQEKRLTKRSGKGYDSLIRCLADWSILQSRPVTVISALPGRQSLAATLPSTICAACLMIRALRPLCRQRSLTGQTALTLSGNAARRLPDRPTDASDAIRPALF